MFTLEQEKYLQRRFLENKVVLFLGAGFSANITNQLNQPMPLGLALAKGLWGLLYNDPFEEGTNLPDIYEALLLGGVSHSRITSFLEDNFISRDIPHSYDILTRVYWYRIYTTNIDDAIKKIYMRVGWPKLEIISYPDDETRERDQGLDSLQAIYLHGSLPCKADEITFSVGQYANRANQTSPLYQQFVSDYATYTTIFIGTELNEPLFWQHIAAREQRKKGISEQRPQSFLISPKIPAPRRTQLEAFHVEPIIGYTDDFLRWLQRIERDLPSKEQVLRKTLPSVASVFDKSNESNASKRDDLKKFGMTFHLVQAEMSAIKDRSFYLLGATPRWEDIFNNLDAPRIITSQIASYIKEVHDGKATSRVIALLGSAGSGKSTILRRLGVNLAQDGQTVFLTNSEDVTNSEILASALESLDRPTVLLFDNAEIALGDMTRIVERTATLKYPPIIIIASRINEFDQRTARLQALTEIKEFPIQNLTRTEIVSIIHILDKAGLLGDLQGLTDPERIRQFEEYAQRQILVAMRQATTGLGFDQIIRDEFERLPSRETQLLYLCVALATDAGYRIIKQQFVRCSRVAPAETLHILERSLAGIVIHTGPQKDLLLLRHRAIAEYVVDVAASRALLAEAYIRLLSALANETSNTFQRTRTSGLHRELVSHDKIFTRFAKNLDAARSIFDSISDVSKSHAHYWLQYGLLELEFGNIEFAENYLKQAESISPSSNYVQNSIGHLFLKKAILADSTVEAHNLRSKGSEILVRQMSVDESPYPYHIYCMQRLSWARKWLNDKNQLRLELEHLREVIRDARQNFSRNSRLRILEGELLKEYMYLVIE